MPPTTATIVIPARLESSRLPRKMLLADTGRPLIEHTWRAARGAAAAGLVVATDSEEIAEVVRGFGGEVVMTSVEADSGTSRIVEALPSLPATPIIVNLQGDEPEIDPEAIDRVVALLDRCDDSGVATLVTPITEVDRLHDPAIVKAVLTPHRHAGDWRAIYFSRAAVPAARAFRPEMLTASPPLYWQHVGLYAYRRELLESWHRLPCSRLAAIESLEQLRFLEAGVGIVATSVEEAAPGIDTADDYAAFVGRCCRS